MLPPPEHLLQAPALVIYRCLAEDDAPVVIPLARLDALRNTGGDIRTIRLDSKVVRESDGRESNSDTDRWMRATLATVGKTDRPRDRQGGHGRLGERTGRRREQIETGCGLLHIAFLTLDIRQKFAGETQYRSVQSPSPGDGFTPRRRCRGT